MHPMIALEGRKCPHFIRLGNGGNESNIPYIMIKIIELVNDCVRNNAKLIQS